MNDAPADVTACNPVDLIAQQVRHHYPNKTGNDQQIREHGDEQTTCLIAKERGLEKRLGCEQTKNSERAHGQKFFHEP